MTRQELDELKEKLTAMKAARANIEVIANLFSNSVWAILPQKIKVYFEQYRGV